MGRKKHLVRLARSSSSRSPSTSHTTNDPPVAPQRKRLRRLSVEENEPSILVSPEKPKNNGKNKLLALAKEIENKRKKQRRSSYSYNYSESESEVESDPGDVEIPKANLLRSSFTNFFSNRNVGSEKDYYSEGEFDDFICDDDEEVVVRDEDGDASLSGSDVYSPSDEIYLRREYEEMQNQKLLAMESLSFIKAFKRYIMYLGLCMFSPNFQFPFQSELANPIQNNYKADQKRVYDSAYFQPAIDKIEKFVLAKRDQYDTKPFPKEFKQTLSLYSNINHQELEDIDDVKMCQACRSYRGVRYELLLDGNQYNSAKVWDGDISEWYRSSNNPWLGTEAFPGCPDPTHNLVDQTSPVTDDNPTEVTTRSYKNYTISKDGKLNLTPGGIITRCQVPVGSHCCIQAKMWHHLHHYKYYLLNLIYNKLKKADVSKLQEPLVLIKQFKKGNGNDFYKVFESKVISAVPTKLKRTSKNYIVPSEPLH